MSDTARRVRDIPGPAGDQVDVAVQDGLTCILTAIHPDVEACHG
jgi:hypothetical protein